MEADYRRRRRAASRARGLTSVSKRDAGIDDLDDGRESPPG